MESLGGKRKWGSVQVCYTKGNVFYSLKGPLPPLYNLDTPWVHVRYSWVLRHTLGTLGHCFFKNPNFFIFYSSFGSDLVRERIQVIQDAPNTFEDGILSSPPTPCPLGKVVRRLVTICSLPVSFPLRTENPPVLTLEQLGEWTPSLLFVFLSSLFSILSSLFLLLPIVFSRRSSLFALAASTCQ